MCAFACFVSDGQGHSYDLSPLALDSRNWEVEPSAVTIGKRFYINVCRSLVQMGGQCPSVPVSSPLAAAAPVSSDSHSRRPNCSTGSSKCPSNAASCLNVGDEYVSLGQVESAPTWDRGVLRLQYSSGQACPDGRRNRTSVIRFKCDKDKVVRRKCC